jgi:hypothetical protein
MLGYGYDSAGLASAMRSEPDFIGVDAGSTDPGPYYLGSGNGFVKLAQIQRDLEPALCAARVAGIPLIIGTAGGSGSRPHLETMANLVRKLALKNGLHFRLALITADMDSAFVVDALREGKISPCGPVPPLTEKDIMDCSHLVGQMGTEPIIDALNQGADVVLAGRCCDTAIFAALPIQRGLDAGLALHSAKIAECGALCAQPAGANDSLHVILNDDSFVVEPVAVHRRCTPDSVAAHSLYEQPDPTGFYEPEGFVDLSGCTFTRKGDRAVRVTGSMLQPAAAQTIKLEGAVPCGYRAVTLAGVADPLIITHLADIEAGVREAVARNLVGIICEDDYQLIFRRYGLDAVTGHRKEGEWIPAEVGLLIEAIAPTRELAGTVLSLARSTALHQPFDGRKTTAGNLAFPFSPSDMDGGEVYRFGVYHLMEIEPGEQLRLFPIVMEEL